MALQRRISLIAGLGNPGPEYEQTRHNAGFWFVDALAQSLGTNFKTEAKFHGAVCKLSFAAADGTSQECWLFRPINFMNRSGQALASLAGFYKIPVADILVVHDELDLPVGTVRVKQGGGHGGHNGLRDIIAHIGDDFLRLRIGIGHPGKGSDVTGYVLSRPPKSEEVQIKQVINDALSVVPLLLSGDTEKAMQQLHSQV